MSDDVWNILTRTRRGDVSLLKNLTEDQARQTMQRLRKPRDRGDPWSDSAIADRVRGETDRAHSVRVQMYQTSDDDLKQIECWGPSGAILEVWPKPDDFDERYAKALDAARIVAEINAQLKKKEPA